jgi:hypothetical protein
MSEKPAIEPPTEQAVGIVVAQSSAMGHVLLQDSRGARYAFTSKVFSGEWSALRHGDVVELVVTREPMPEVLAARPATTSPSSST